MKNLLKPALQAFKPYITGKPIEEVRREYGLTGRIAKLASNENPLGPSPEALKAVKENIDQIFQYPDDNAYYFRKKIADSYGVKLENIFASCGSVEIIELLGLAFLNSGENIVTSERTFAVYSLISVKAGAQTKLAKMIDGGFRYDLPAIAKLIDSKTKIVFLANPTNPTGTWFTKGEFDDFMKKVPEDVLVVYDSAYEEFCTETNLPDPMSYIKAGRRLLYLRTFSKAYGLAGLRIGYAVGPIDIIHGLMTCRTPFNTSLLSQKAALAAFDDKNFVKRSREHASKELSFIRNELEDEKVTIPPSQTNFLLIDTEKDADWLFVELQKRGVIVRPMGSYDMPRAIRVSPGLREDNENFVNNFRKLLRD